jgi:hypothetical protein
MAHNDHHQQSPRFFANLTSVVFFVLILSGIFLLVAKIYAPYIIELKEAERSQKRQQLLSQQDTVQQDTLAPYVRGITSGVQTAVLINQKKEEALHINRINGYFNGIKVAVLTSLNWHDLDRELFQSNGLMSGFTTSLSSSRQEYEQSPGGYSAVIIDKMKIALSRNIEEMLANSPDRRSTLNTYIRELQILQDESTAEITFLTSDIQDSTSRLAEAKSLQREAVQQVETDTNNYDLKSIGGDTSNLQQANSEATRLQTRINIFIKMRTELINLNSKIPPLLAALQKNYEALAQDIRVAPVQGVKIPIYQQ